MASDEIEQEHGVRDGVYCNLTGTQILFCLCGEACRGGSWEECGGLLDEHLAEVEK